MMKQLLKQFLFGGVIGFFGAFFMIMTMNGVEMNRLYIFFGLAIIIGLCMIVSMSFIVQIRKGMKQEVSGEEEDDLDRYLYLKSSDLGLLSNTMIALSILLICMGIMEQFHYGLVLTAIILAGVAGAIQYYQSALFKKMYPERDMPSMNDPEYAKKLVNIADEGERFVMLQGMMKAFNMYTMLLIFAIICSTVYSLFSPNQQMFSVVLMVLILIISNGAYFLTIRKKA